MNCDYIIRVLHAINYVTKRAEDAIGNGDNQRLNDELNEIKWLVGQIEKDIGVVGP
jgi:hypothetical protein